MDPPLLVRAWMAAHLYGAKYQAVVCCAGTAGEAAFRESLQPQYTSSRHDAKGLRTYYITGTCGDACISRITSGCIEKVVAGVDGPLHITVTSNTNSWQEGDLGGNDRLTTLSLDLERLIEISTSVLVRCSNLGQLDLASLRAIEAIPEGFLGWCTALKEIDLTPLVNVKEVGPSFLTCCTNIKRINLAPLHAIDAIPNDFLTSCVGLKGLDLSPFVNLKKVGFFFWVRFLSF